MNADRRDALVEETLSAIYDTVPNDAAYSNILRDLIAQIESEVRKEVEREAVIDMLQWVLSKPSATGHASDWRRDRLEVGSE